MLKTVTDACQLEEGTLDYGVATGVENLTETIDAPDGGQAFFQRNYMTRGMEELLREGLIRLAGGTDQAVFQLAQAMGGGKTHLLAALGLLAKHPQRRVEVLTEDILDRVDNQAARVAVFDGRESPDEFLWGSIAKQLGSEADRVMRPFWSEGAKPPAKDDWKQAIGDEPTLILFDELPPYFQEAITTPVGAGTLNDVLTRALANLFVAALELPRCCIVLANLTEAYADQIQNIQQIVGNIQSEANRQAKTLTPVALDGSEIYAILRQRLFHTLPTDQEINAVAEAFANEIHKAEQGNYFRARSLEQVAAEVRETYPFHPSFKNLVTLFKDNPGFRETRGLLQFAARTIRSVWNRAKNDVYLIGAQHLDLNDRVVRDEVTDINRALHPAITHDLADQGSAHAELIDADANNDAASQVGALILASSLSLAVKGHTGLREEEVIEYLLVPNRQPDEFAKSFDQLRRTAWYLHKEAELFFFKDTENLIRRIQSEAEGLPQAKVDNALAKWLEAQLEPRSRQAYQHLLVMPKPKEVQEEVPQRRVLVVAKPDGTTPPEEMRRLWASLEEKNHLLILSGNDTHMNQKVEWALRQYMAVETILEGIRDNETLRKDAQHHLEQAKGAFTQALQSAFNRLFYPNVDPKTGEGDLVGATIANGLRFPGEGDQTPEKQIEEMLASMHCDNKLVRDLESDPGMYLEMAEHELWPKGGERRVPWRDILLRARTMPEWPWMPGGKGMETLKRLAVRQGRWRDLQDGHIEKGPFPKERTAVSVMRQDPDPQTGEVTLQLVAQNAGPDPQIHYAETSAVSEQDPVVENPEVFRTAKATLYFLAVDTQGEHEIGEPTRWTARFDIRHQVHPGAMSRSVELQVLPTPETVRYTLDGTNPREGRLYDGPFEVGDNNHVLQVFAQGGEAEATATFQIPVRTSQGEDGEDRPDLDPYRPAALTPTRPGVPFNDTAAVFNLIQSFKGRQVKLQDVNLYVGDGERAVQVRFNRREVSPANLEEVIQSLRKGINEEKAPVQIQVRGDCAFGTGQDLREFAEMAGIELTRTNVQQH